MTPLRTALLASAAIALAACGGGASGTSPTTGATPPATPTPTPTATATTTAGATPCTPGSWGIAAPDPGDTANAGMPVRLESAHFAIRWLGDTTTVADAQKAADHLEYVWDYFIGTIGFPAPYCGSATKYKINVFVGRDYGLTGGADALGHGGMWIGPGGLLDRFGLAHEFTHGLQALSGGLQDSPYSGWLYESHANWMTHQLPEFRSITHCSVLSVNYPHLYYGSTRVRYCNWQFLEYIKDRFGYQAINDIWTRSPRRGEAGFAEADPIEVLMRNRGWSLAQLNDAFGDWAMHNANWDYTNPDGSDQGAVYRRDYGGYEQQQDDRLLRATVLDPIDLAQRRFAVPAGWAPQRWGYNLVKLYPDAGAATVGVSFRGVVQSASAVATLPGLADEPATIPPPASDWRWGLVAVGADGKSRYSALQRGADGAASIAVRGDDRGLYLVVTATPAVFHHVRWDQPYYSLYRYPWMAQFTGAMPERYQPGAPVPVANGRRHGNGGGWVAAGASVDASAYVGPYARVLSGAVRDTARVEDHAVVYGGQLRDNARAGALSVIRGNTILRNDARAATTFLGLGEYEQNIVLSGKAQNVGDVEQRGGSAAKGVYYGFVDQGATTDARRGATLTAPVPEVTAAPTYVWRE